MEIVLTHSEIEQILTEHIEKTGIKILKTADGKYMTELAPCYICEEYINFTAEVDAR